MGRRPAIKILYNHGNPWILVYRKKNYKLEDDTFYVDLDTVNEFFVKQLPHNVRITPVVNKSEDGYLELPRYDIINTEDGLVFDIDASISKKDWSHPLVSSDFYIKNKVKEIKSTEGFSIVQNKLKDGTHILKIHLIIKDIEKLSQALTAAEITLDQLEENIESRMSTNLKKLA